MNIDKPWYHFKFSTDNAISEKGNEVISKIVNSNELTIINFREFDLFDQDWLKHLSDSIDNEISSLMIFYRPPYLQYPTAHIDLDTHMIKKTGEISTTPGAINLIYRGRDDDSEMIWYKTPDIKSTDIKWNQANTTYLEFNPADLTEIDRCCIGTHLTLVKTDVPHNIIMGSSPRLCLSLRFKWSRWKNPTWAGLVDQCKDSLIK